MNSPILAAIALAGLAIAQTPTPITGGSLDKRTRDILNDNFSRAVIKNADGSLSVDKVFSLERDRFSRQYTALGLQQCLAKIQLGLTGTTCIIGLIGDSWMANHFIDEPIEQYMQARYGNGGFGFLGAAAASTQPYSGSGASVVTLGTWTDTDAATTSLGPDIADTTSSDTATPASKTFTCPAPTTDITIHYALKTGGGNFGWNLDSGAATGSVSTAGTAAYSVANPAGLGTLANSAHTVSVTVTSAGSTGVTIFGVDCQNNGYPGVRFHRLGNAGTQISTWLAVNQVNLKAGWSALGIGMFITQFGVNEMAGSVAPATYQANLTSLVAAERAAVTSPDILISVPADVGVASSYTMDQYESAALTVARLSQTGFVSLYRNLSNYTLGNSRNLYGDTAHLNQYGGQLAANVMLSYLTDGVLPNQVSVNLSKFNLFQGDHAGGVFQYPTGTNNTGVGPYSLGFLTTGSQNTAHGFQTLFHLTTGNFNTASGYNALSTVTTGLNNTAFGATALNVATTSSNNAAFGFAASGLNTTGSNNTHVGFDAGYSNLTGGNNASLGTYSLFANTASNNVALGYGAGYTGTGANANTTGNNNTFLGYNSGPGSTTQQTFMTTIGSGATGTCNSCVVLGRSTDVTVIGTSVPASASAACSTGTITWGSGFVYVCVATNTWQRAAIATW